jgi:organic radical activating enzyme
MNQNLKVIEIFQSLQGEGANVGLSCVFIRLAGCNMSCPFCDTIWDGGTEMSVLEILSQVKQFNVTTIVWTGGEPTLQLTDEVLGYFAEYKNCIETNGSNKVPDLIDYVAVSPKVPASVVCNNFKFVDEIRYAVSLNDPIPDFTELPPANNYYLSPIFDNLKLNRKNVNYCLRVIEENPKWKLSIQMHKLLKIR